MQHAGGRGRKPHPWFSLKLRISHLASMLSQRVASFQDQHVYPISNWQE
jgi:hypothetical protein